MTQERLENDKFLEKLTELLKTQSSKTRGTLFLTQKRLTHESSETDGNSFPVLIRVTNGTSTREDRKGKVKIATVVQASDLDAFFGKYAEVCRGGMDGLRKRDRKARKRNKGKAKE